MSTEVIDLCAPIRWLTSGAAHCFAASSDGGIYDLRAPQKPAYQHRHEPYRAAVSADGRFVASGDWNGTLQVWDINLHRITNEATPFSRARITDLTWIGDTLVTADAAGIVRLLTNDLRVVRTWSVGSAVRYMGASSRGIAAALTNGTVWKASLVTGVTQTVLVGANCTAFGISSDAQTIAIGTDDGEVLVLGAERNLSAYHFESGSVGCATFEDDKTLLVCSPSGRIFRIALTLKEGFP